MSQSEHQLINRNEFNEAVSKMGLFAFFDNIVNEYIDTSLVQPSDKKYSNEEIFDKFDSFSNLLYVAHNTKDLISQKSFKFDVCEFDFERVQITADRFKTTQEQLQYLKYVQMEYKDWYMPIIRQIDLEHKQKMFIENCDQFIEISQIIKFMTQELKGDPIRFTPIIHELSFEEKIQNKIVYLEDTGELFCDSSISLEVKSLPENLLRSKPTKKVEVLDGSECSLLLKFMMDKGIFLRPNSELDIGLIGHYLTGYSQDHVRKAITTHYYDNIRRTKKNTKLERIVLVLEELIEYINNINNGKIELSEEK